MSVMVCRRWECDRPGCTFAEYSPHGYSTRSRDQMKARGWKLIRWKVGRGAGAGFLIALCSVHSLWRPRRGREFEPGKVPLYKWVVDGETQTERAEATRRRRHRVVLR